MRRGSRLRRRSTLAALAMTAVLSLSLVACGSSKPILTIGARETAEEQILAQIYSQALEHAGYTVEEVFDLGYAPGDATEALEQGKVSGFTEHLSSATTFDGYLGRKLDEVPTDPQKAFRRAKAELGREGLLPFPPTPFEFTNLIGALKGTAEKRGLRTVSDLRGQSREMTITGFAGCHQADNCVGGLERNDGFRFAGFIYEFGIPTEPFEAIETRFSDLAMLPSTDGRLFAEKSKLATLEGAEDRFPAANAIFITSPQIADEAGSDFEATIVAAQKGLTLPVMQRLDAAVELEGRTPEKVAADYLKTVDLSG